MPRDFETGILYVSEEYGVAGHLCPCGCGSKIITPLGATDWTLTEINGRASLKPSVGNWQIPCKSHYWITNGEIEWSHQWTEEQITAGRRAEEQRSKSYYNNKFDLNRKKQTFITRLVNWFFRKS